MDPEKKKISDFLASHLNIHLATISPDGKPVVATVAYVNDDTGAYIVTDNSSRKTQNIAKNPNVAFTSDFEMTGMNDIRGVQMQGKAEILRDKADIDKAMGLLITKHPQMANLPPMPCITVIKITFTEGYMPDYSVRFMHCDKAAY